LSLCARVTVAGSVQLHVATGLLLQDGAGYAFSQDPWPNECFLTASPPLPHRFPSPSPALPHTFGTGATQEKEGRSTTTTKKMKIWEEGIVVVAE
jgi:hypothetical protein